MRIDEGACQALPAFFNYLSTKSFSPGSRSLPLILCFDRRKALTARTPPALQTDPAKQVFSSSFDNAFLQAAPFRYCIQILSAQGEAVATCYNC